MVGPDGQLDYDGLRVPDSIPAFTFDGQSFSNKDFTEFGVQGTLFYSPDDVRPRGELRWKWTPEKYVYTLKFKELKGKR